MRNKILIAGASGFLGSSITMLLVKEGFQVKALVHNRNIPDVENIKFNETTDLAELIKDCSVVINCVGIIREKKKGDFQKIHVDFQKRLVDTAFNGGIKNYIYISANGVESDLNIEYFKTKKEAENILIKSGLRFFIARPSIIEGENDKFLNLLRKIIKTFHFIPIPGQGNFLLQPIKVEDVTKEIVNHVKNIPLKNEIRVLAGNKIYTYLDLLKRIAEEQKKGFVILHIPVPLFKFFVKVTSWLPFSPLTYDQLLMLLNGNIKK